MNPSLRQVTPPMRVCNALLVLAVLACPLAAQDEFDRIKPKEPPRKEKVGLIIEGEEKEVSGDQKELVGALKGVVFLTPDDTVTKETTGIEGIRTERVPLLNTAEFRMSLQTYLGKPVSLQSINRMAHAAVLYHRQGDHPVVDIAIPEQDITTGVVQLVVMEARAGTVKTEGHRWFSESTLRQAISIRSGDVITASGLHRQLDCLNQNPFRSVDVELRPGVRAGETDVIFATEDRFPVRFYAGYEDTGNIDSGRGRVLEGFNWGNAFMQGHELSYQHTHGLDYDAFAGHAVTYHVPLPLYGHELTALGSWSHERFDVETGHELDIAWQFGLRHRIALPGPRTYRHAVEYGFDYKRFDVDVDDDAKSMTDIIEFTVQYDGEFNDAWGTTAFTLVGTASPGGLSERNNDRNFHREREDASAQYVYGNLGLERVWNLPAGITLANRAMVQFASARLLESEQLAFGGYQNVRGYDEGEIPSDEGLFCSAELRSPEWMLGKFGNADRFENQLQLLAFVDAGFADIKSRNAGEEGSVKLAGAGAGFRYTMGEHIELRFDYAFKLKDTGEGRREDGRMHLGVTVGF